MDGLYIQDAQIREKITILNQRYEYLLTPIQAQFTRLVLMRYRQYSENEYYLYVIVLYAYLYFKIIPIDDPIIEEPERKHLQNFSSAFRYEMSGDADGYVKSMIELEEDLFLLKIIIKYTALLSEEQYGGFIPALPNYYTALGWLIPLLSYKNYQKIAGVLQDIYFEKLYPEQYLWTKEMHSIQIDRAEVMENFMVDITNDIMGVMERLGVFGAIRMRKKSYFSIYNKIIRKQSTKIYDFIGTRVILNNPEDLKSFVTEFEKRFIIKTKKDYVSHPKANGYQGIHYTFIYAFKNLETEMELQVRTREIDEATYSMNDLCHFTYSCDKNKWHPIFKEIYQGMELVKKYMPKWEKGDGVIKN